MLYSQFDYQLQSMYSSFQLKMLREELKVANDQYKELSIALEQQQSQFSSLQVRYFCGSKLQVCSCRERSFFHFQLNSNACTGCTHKECLFEVRIERILP